MRPTLAYALTDGRATYSAARVFRPSLYVLRNTIDRQQHCGALNRPGYIAATAKWPQILWIIVRWVFVFMIDVDGLPRERLAAQLARRKRVAMPFIDDCPVLPHVTRSVCQRMFGKIQLPVAARVLPARSPSQRPILIAPIPHEPKVMFLANLLLAIHRFLVAPVDLAIYGVA
jgi:hypothetical protein